MKKFRIKIEIFIYLKLNLLFYINNFIHYYQILYVLFSIYIYYLKF
jgi:hypothetical protein